MKILHVLTDPRNDRGILAASACGMAAAVAAREHEVTMACLKHAGEGANLQAENVLIRSFAPDRISPRMPSADLRAYLQKNVQYFDIVHIHGVGQSAAQYAAATARQAKIPYLLTPHRMLESGYHRIGGRVGNSFNWLMRDSKVVRHAGAIQCLYSSEITNSPALAGRKNAIIANGMALTVCENLPPRGSWRTENHATLGKLDRPLALFLGRIEPQNGLDRLLPHWPALLKQQPDLLLVIAGTGEKSYIDTLNDLIRKHNLARHIVWTGELTGPAKWRTLVDSDVFILPANQADGSPAITEAMASGLPVVLTRECHRDEVENHNAGVIIEHGDMAAFVTSILELMGNHEIRASMGQNGQKLVQSGCTWEVTAEKLERLYESLVLHADIPPDLLPPKDIS